MCHVIHIGFGYALGKVRLCQVSSLGYVWQILGSGAFLPPRIHEYLCKSLYWIGLTLFRVVLFGPTHFPKLFHIYSAMIKFGTVITYLKNPNIIKITWVLVTWTLCYWKSASFATSTNRDTDCILVNES